MFMTLTVAFFVVSVAVAAAALLWQRRHPVAPHPEIDNDDMWDSIR